MRKLVVICTVLVILLSLVARKGEAPRAVALPERVHVGALADRQQRARDRDDDRVPGRSVDLEQSGHGRDYSTQCEPMMRTMTIDGRREASWDSISWAACDLPAAAAIAPVTWAGPRAAADQSRSRLRTILASVSTRELMRSPERSTASRLIAKRMRSAST